LVVLPKSARLRPFESKYWALIVQANRLRAIVHAALYVRPADRGRSFGPERHLVAAMIFKRVHLVFDDFCFGANAFPE
jgi:hypothetical protein